VPFGEGRLNRCRDGMFQNKIQLQTLRFPEQGQWLRDLSMSRSEGETWQIIGAFAIVFALFVAATLMLT
jgi:hypothetical protein